ncbi:thermonuclease family protein [Yoonia vestfoldensis]|jgi:endonuclease YncB( thermonuclease family)|uniref:Nuclease n=1 Tax=Yoonia vestfoldensis TaxID=245188 RepID=A0A1Y0ECY0_9RHOB|nr:thermonuclease family protein [Yoonia vestfoldensis]ARU01443.1 nuclease [Yoonia vestfoldensis]
MLKALILLGLIAAFPAHADPSGTLRVIDADTVDIGGARVRLYGLDAPEMGQPCLLDGQSIDCGRWAADLVRARFEGQYARCITRDIDRYGRQVATCDVGGADIGQVIVAAGWAVAYRRYTMRYDLDEKAAAVAGRGLWASVMQDPETYRASRSIAPAAPDPACNIKGNISGNGRIYHRPGNRDYDRTVINEAQGERWFCSEAEARAAGWRAARN